MEEEANKILANTNTDKPFVLFSEYGLKYLTDMIENTDEEPKVERANTSFENSQEIIIPDNNNETINQTQAANNMETHANHLHHAPGHKKWHYFYEFLMLFLAVFCGFFAENQREHMVENSRAREFAKTLVEDLARDTTEILDVIREDRIVLGCFDSVTTSLQTNNHNSTVPGSFYYFCNIGTFSPAVMWNNSTLTQITQTGSLRYFSNEVLVKKLSTYFSLSEFISIQNNYDSRYRDESIKLRNRILMNSCYTKYSAFTIISWRQTPDSLMTVRLPIQGKDPELLNEFANSFETRKRIINLLISSYYSEALNTAAELISILKKEYALE